MSNQLQHTDHFFNDKKFPITLLLDNVSGPANIGSIFRLADAFNIEKIIICGKNINLDSPRVLKTARSTIKKVDFEIYENPKEAIKAFSDSKDFTTFALEITDDSIAIEKVDFPKTKKIILIVGNENMGIDQELLDFANQKIHINMFGYNSSMNVAQATGIAFYEITKHLSAIDGK